MSEEILASSSLAIEARGLTKLFGERPALRDVDLKVNKGEHLVIFGPNGAGKTTLIKILASLVKPTSGNIWLDGININDKQVQIRQKLSLVSHQTFLYDDLSIYENLRFFGKMYDVQNLEHQIKRLVSWVQLDSRINDRVGTLSHGMQQRVSIARAILHNPSILFLDEPEVGLDLHVSSVINDLINGIDSNNRTVVMTTHNLERGLELSSRVIILDRGKIVYEANKDKIVIPDFRKVYEQYTETSK
jgi:heme exporter protein A